MWELHQAHCRSASMRPRQSSLGILPESYGTGGTRYEASMRPRQSSLGIYVHTNLSGTRPTGRFNEAEAIKPRNQDFTYVCDTRVKASMRPRQSSLGICRRSGRDRQGRGCFNEAEAIKPRNRGCECERRGERCGFNEAEAIKPRNRGDPEPDAPHEHFASMRPRQSSLGIRKAAAVTRRDPCGFNEAEAIKPRNLVDGLPAVLDPYCFNEAEAIKPRNPGHRGQG